MISVRDTRPQGVPVLNLNSPQRRKLSGFWPLTETHQSFRGLTEGPGIDDPIRYDLSGHNRHLDRHLFMPAFEPTSIGWAMRPQVSGINHAGARSAGIAVPANSEGQPPRSMACWIKINDATRVTTTIMGHSSTAFYDVYGIALQFDNGTLRAIGETNNSNAALTTGLTDTTKFHHIGARFTADGALFLDGKKVDSGALDDGWGYPLTVGVNNLGNDNLFDGWIAHACYWDRGLTDKEFADHYSPEFRWDLIDNEAAEVRAVAVAAVANPHGPLGHPLWGPLAGPVAA